MIGPGQRAVLAGYAAADGLTVAEVAELTGRTRENARVITLSLARRRYAVILRYRRDGRHRIAIWGATGTGRRELAACQPEGVQS